MTRPLKANLHAQPLICLPLVLACSLFAPHGLAQDRAELDRTRILGNRELPKVTYIVPWKKPLPDDLNAKPARSVLDELLTPVDRDVHRRQVAYHAALQTLSPSPSGATAVPTAPNAVGTQAAVPLIRTITPQPQPQDKKP